MLTTQQARDAWGPPCSGPSVKIALYGHGIVSVRPEIVDAVHTLNACLEQASYETRAADTGAYNCRKITGGTGYSLHAYKIALDINWESNPYGPKVVTDMPPSMVAAIKAIRTKNGKQVWRWGGDYSGNKDCMHFEVVCDPADIATGIDPATVPSNAPAAPQEDDDDMFKMMLLKITAGDDHGTIWLVGPSSVEHVQLDELPELVRAWGKEQTIPGLSDNAVAWDHVKTNAAVKDH